MSDPHYRRILLKLSGEALAGAGGFGIDPACSDRYAADVQALVRAGVEVALVVGGGNIFRGAWLAQGGLVDRVAGDQMGMLATVMNSLALQDALRRLGIKADLYSALAIQQIALPYSRRAAVESLEQGRVALLAAGTGNPFFTTDSAASLRAIELGVELLIKATKVDGVYSDDPLANPNAAFYPRLSYDRALSENLQVMDTTAIVLCRDHGMPLRVMNINSPGALQRLVQGEDVGSLVESGDEA